MKIVITTCLVPLTSPVAAEEQQRVYQTDAYGRVQHNKPSYSVGEDGRIVEVDPYGNRQHHKQQYVIRKTGSTKVDRTETSSCTGSSTRSWTARCTRPTRTAGLSSRSSSSRTNSDARSEPRRDRRERH